jgi:hypothetical protein
LLRTGKPLTLVNFVLDMLAEDGHIELEKYGGGAWSVGAVSPSLKRSLSQGPVAGCGDAQND